VAGKYVIVIWFYGLLFYCDSALESKYGGEPAAMIKDILQKLRNLPRARDHLKKYRCRSMFPL